MTCNFCGSILNDDEMECPYCGHRTGVVKAEEYYEEPEDGEYYDEGPEQDPEPETKREPARTRKAGNAGNAGKKNKIPGIDLAAGLERLKNAGKKGTDGGSRSGVSKAAPLKKLNSPMIMMIALAACALLCLICLISVASLRGQVEDLNQSILSQLMQMQNTDQQLASRMDQLANRSANAGTSTAVQKISSSITITKEPTASATYLGRGGSEDSAQNVPIFTVNATGINLSFSWQRLDETTGSWVDIVFDAEGNNSTYGFHVSTDIARGYSELSAHGVTSAAYGYYRCQISDSSGSATTAVVDLTQRSNS